MFNIQTLTRLTALRTLLSIGACSIGAMLVIIGCGGKGSNPKPVPKQPLQLITIVPNIYIVSKYEAINGADTTVRTYTQCEGPSQAFTLSDDNTYTMKEECGSVSGAWSVTNATTSATLTLTNNSATASNPIYLTGKAINNDAHTFTFTVPGIRYTLYGNINN